MQTESQVMSIVSGPMVQAAVDGAKSPEEARRLVDVNERVLRLREYLRQHPHDVHNAARVRELYGLLFHEDPEDMLGEHASFKGLRTALVARLRSMRKERGTGGRSSRRSRQEVLATRLMGETAMLLEIKQLMRSERLEEAEALIKEVRSEITVRDHRVDLLMFEVEMLERAGRYKAALNRIERIKKQQDRMLATATDRRDAGTLEAPFIPRDFSPIEDDLRYRAGLPLLHEASGAAQASGRLGIVPASIQQGNATTGAAVAATETAETTLPREISFGGAYPNPFNVRATLPLDLPASADVRVEVFDLLGRRVALLADDVLAAGTHKLVFDGRGLSSGTYVVRARIRPSDDAQQVITHKITLVQ